MLRLPQLLTWLALCLACTLGCGPPQGDPHTPAALRQALERAESVEIHLAAGGARAESTERALQRASTILSRRTGKNVTLFEGLGGGNPKSPRIVMGTLEDPAMGRLVEELGIEIQDGPFFRGNALRGGRGRWELRGEDPDRPGRPITVYLGVRWKALENTVDRLTLGGRFGLTMVSMREGRRELDWSGRVRGRVFQQTENWSIPAQLETPALAIHMGSRIPIGRATRYQSKATEALAVVSGWMGADLAQQLRLYLVEDPNYLHSYAQSSGLALTVGLHNHRMALMTRGVPDDGGACVASWAAKETLGPAVHPWLQEAAGIDAAGTWWGRDLESWGKYLLAGELLPPLPTIVDPASDNSLSRHQLLPARALLFRYLRVTQGAENLLALWSGEADLDSAHESAFLQWLADSEAEALAQRPEKTTEPSFLTGVALDSNLILGGGFDRTDLSTTLVGAAEAGADSISITSYYTEQPTWREKSFGTGRQACEGDVALAHAVVHSRNAKLSHVALQPHVQMQGSSGHSAWQRRTSPEHWREFFRGLDPALVHYTLLAELCRIDLICIGSSLSRRSANKSLTPEAYETFINGWESAIDSMRTSFGGKLTYAADWDGEVDSYPFWDKLDYVGVSYFPVFKPLGTTEPVGPYLDDRWNVILERMDELAATHGKPTLLMEFGARSVAEGTTELAIGAGAADAQVQLRYYESLAASLERRRADGKSGASTLGGVFAWKWSAHDTVGGTRDRGFHLQGKPAARVLGSLAPIQ